MAHDGARAPIASLERVAFRYAGEEDLALRDVSLTIAPGEVLLLCGATGSGKSTLLRLLMGIVPHLTGGDVRGSVRVLGADATRVPPHELAGHGVTLVAQDPAETFVADRVAAEVAFGPESLALPGAEIDERVRDALRDVGLEDATGRRVRELSGGEQQRVAIAAALALRPRLLLLDEPTAHLDERTARAILAIFMRVVRERGMACVLAEHRLGLAAPLASRALVLDRGTVRAAGAPREVLRDPRVADLGVTVPRAARAAVALGLAPPLPLTPEELAPRIRPRATRAPGPAAASDPAAARVARPQGGVEPALRFDRVAFRYAGAERDAVADVTFAVAPGERVALVGPTGSGKSTLARLALGLRRATRGRAWLAGMPIDSTPFQRIVAAGGLVVQEPVRQILAERVDDELRLGLRHLPRDERESRVEEGLERFQIASLRHRHPLTLSEGERRRVVLAAAIARRPAVLVLDEPTLGQDERHRAGLVAVVRDLATRGTAVLAISHDPEFVNDACDRVLVLREGRLAADLPLSGDGGAVRRLAAADVPLADVPATVMLLADTGTAVRARTVSELAAAVAGRGPAG